MESYFIIIHIENCIECSKRLRILDYSALGLWVSHPNVIGVWQYGDGSRLVFSALIAGSDVVSPPPRSLFSLLIVDVVRITDGNY